MTETRNTNANARAAAAMDGEHDALMAHHFGDTQPRPIGAPRSPWPDHAHGNLRDPWPDPWVEIKTGRAGDPRPGTRIATVAALIALGALSGALVALAFFT